MDSGEIRNFHIGRRRMVLREDLEKFLQDRLDEAENGAVKSGERDVIRKADSFQVRHAPGMNSKSNWAAASWIFSSNPIEGDVESIVTVKD